MKVILWTLILGGAVALILAGMAASERDREHMELLKADTRRANTEYRLNRESGVFSDYPVKGDK